MMKTFLTISLLAFSTSSFAKPQSYKIDAGASKATWEGSKPGGKHSGELKLKSGDFLLEKGELKGGQIEIDMTSIVNKDISDPALNSKLVGHLKNDDFFSVEKHPTSSLKVTKVEKKDGLTMVSGELTIKGITKPVSFPVDLKVNKKSIQAKGEITVDRTLYDIRYRSLKFFSDLADKVIHDEFKVGFEVKASM
jgi:polyisoprenoid-binding protein YceI